LYDDRLVSNLYDEFYRNHHHQPYHTLDLAEQENRIIFYYAENSLRFDR
jgi:hypothetical protein